MKRVLQLKILLFVLAVAMTPIFLLSVVFVPKYSFVKTETGKKYIESVRKEEVTLLQAKYDNLINMQYKFSVIAQTAIGDENIAQNRQLLEFEKEITTKVKGVENGYILNKDSGVLYAFTDRKEYEKQIIEESQNLIFKEQYTVKGVWAETGFYHVLYRKLITDEQLAGYVVLVVNRIFWENEILNSTKDSDIDVYNGLYDILATNSSKKIFSREINDISKAALEGNVETKNIGGKYVSLGFVELEGDDIFVSVVLDKSKYLGNDKFAISFAFALIFSLSVAFLLAWKFIGYVNEYVDKSIHLKEYDDSTIQKLISEIDKNMENVDRVLASVIDFQVVKQDMTKLKERFFRGKDDDGKIK